MHKTSKAHARAKKFVKVKHAEKSAFKKKKRIMALLPKDPEAAHKVLISIQDEALKRNTKKRAGGKLLRPLKAGDVNATGVDKALEDTGPAFGDFVSSVGQAVAKAQSDLDKDLVNTASDLSDKQIDVVAVFEQVIGDDGMMKEGIPHVQKLPLSNYVMPTAYQWSRVFLQADMKVSQFNASSGFNIQQKSSNFGLNVGGGAGATGASISGGLSYGNSNSNTATSSNYGQDSAAGSMHLEATLEPRAAIELPKPYVLQKGAYLEAKIGNRDTVPSSNTNPPPDPKTITGRYADILTVLHGESTAYLQKPIEFSADDPAVLITSFQPGKTDTTTTTDSQGQLTIRVTRTGQSFKDKTNPVPVNVRIWYGLLSQTVTVTV